MPKPRYTTSARYSKKREAPLSSQERAARGLQVERMPWPDCIMCGTENPPGHVCEQMRERRRSIQLGCLVPPAEHSDGGACTSTCNIYPLGPRDKWVPAYARRWKQ